MSSSTGASAELPLDGELATVAARMSGLLLPPETVGSVVDRIVALATKTIARSSGTGVTLVDDDGGFVTSAASSELVRAADALQYELGEGPCLAALAARGTIRIDDTATDDRWPRWCAAAAGQGLRATLTTPLLTRDGSEGALKIYATTPGAFGPSDEHTLMKFAEDVAPLVANARAHERAGRLSEPFKRTLRERDLITLAKGLIMGRDGVDEQTALELLLSTARANGTTPGETGGGARREEAMNADPEEELWRMHAACFARSELTLEQLWMRYFGLGGTFSLFDLDAYLNGLTTLARVDRDMIAHAINERLDELGGPPRAPYSHALRAARPLHGPLTALVSLLEGAHLAPPERLPAVVARAGEALGLRIRVYLADYGQRQLVPLPAGASEPAGLLDIDSGVAGEVFRQAGTRVTHDGATTRLWTVLLDGVERLGVLEVVPAAGADPDDPLLRDQCRWLATLLGHLVTITSQYGDGLDVQRRRRHRGIPAELLWQSLPPLTAATDAVVVGGSVQPAYDLSGTVFDYALSEDMARLAMFDTGPRGQALIAVKALSAYRAARREGAGLDGQHAAVTAALAGDPTPVTGVLAELDLRTGRLRQLNAGHPASLVVHGQEIRSLGTGPRFGAGTPELAEDDLDPRDLLVVYSGGVTEARDPDGNPFGRARLLDGLVRQASALPPEIARLLTGAVTAHTGGRLRRDAGILVTRWVSRPPRELGMPGRE